MFVTIRYDRWLKRNYTDPFTLANTAEESLKLANERDARFSGTSIDNIVGTQKTN